MTKATRIFIAVADGELDSHRYDGKSNHPAVYVGTYGKYNSGSLDGAWVDLTTFDNRDDCIDWCRNVLHGDEDDPELMFQDYENFPSTYYDEGSLSDELWDYIDALEDHDKEIVDAVLENNHSLSSLDDCIVYPNCDSMKDVAYEMCAEMGFEAFSRETWESVFDYDQFGREIQWDMDDEEKESYEGMTDSEVGMQYVNDIGGLEVLGEETIENYADMDELGRLIEMDGDWIKYDNGYIQVLQ